MQKFSQKDSCSNRHVVITTGDHLYKTLEKKLKNNYNV